MKGDSAVSTVRKVIALAFMMAALYAPGAPAAADTVTAMATEPYMETYAVYACHARILRYDDTDGMLEIGLMFPEIFSREDIVNLTPGDAIYTGGREVAVRTVDADEDGTIVLNCGENGAYAEDEVLLNEDTGGNYRTVSYVTGAYIMNEADRISVPVRENMLFLDMNDPESDTDGMPDLPAVHTAEEFLELFKENGPEDFSNLYVVFDINGEPAVVYRLYTPW